MLSLYSRLSLISGEGGGNAADDGYGVFGGAAVDACASFVAFCVLAASVVIWEACAFAAMVAALVAAACCLASKIRARASTVPPPVAAPGGEHGLTDAAIDEELPAFTYERLASSGSLVDAAGGLTCSVCLDDVRGGELVRSLPECRHLFHVRCIDVWLRSHPTCPLCRFDLSPRRRVLAAAAAGSAAATPLPPP
ncbi:hypothetical protein ACP70R_029367 [Stipagrostis hirtigluma subsp. patula]